MENNVFTEQLKYKVLIEEKGLKKVFVASKMEINNSLFSQYLNGRLYMPLELRAKLDSFLNL